MKIISITGIVLSLIISAYTQHPDAGSVLFRELNINFDARSVAMSGASIAIMNGTGSALVNPALPSLVINNQAYIGFRTIMDGVWYSPMGFTHNFKKAGTLTLSIIGSSNNFEQIDDDGGNPVYTGYMAGADFFVGGLTWGYSFSKEISAGASIKGMYNRLNSLYSTYSVKGMAADIGVLYHISRDRFVAGLVIRNAGFIFQSNQEMEASLPLTVEAGLSFFPEHAPALRIAIDANKRIGDYVNFEPGIEVNVYRKVLFLRGGFNFSTSDIEHLFKIISGDQDKEYVKSNWNLLSAGAGFCRDFGKANMQVDLGFQFYSSLIPPSVVVSALCDF